MTPEELDRWSDRDLVCSVCGLRVLRVGLHDGWKHAGGGHAVSCGRPPAPERITTRAAYEADIDAVRATVRMAFNRDNERPQ